ncbi:hypothetical protein D9619_008230 [Psilocybe cf. subviscida]|uniref:Protein kinase domain-containing protein n=1 Tax=Psilocybe cf. subviscida TaxID=2480587 RepID=A0A8H5ATV4_9AGAR|nr:hypothetical protein D9619_008230 [Psilocybe cf. subviscida]
MFKRQKPLDWTLLAQIPQHLLAGYFLLNLTAGRSPWKSATPSDPTFQAYPRHPEGFLPSVLPISPEVNAILVRMLYVNWPERANFREVRHAIERESGVGVYDSSSSRSTLEHPGPSSPIAQSDADRKHGFRIDFERAPSLASNRTAEASRPNTPNNFNLTFDSSIAPPRIYDADRRMTSFSPNTSIMHTAIEYDPYSPMTFVNSPILPKQQRPVGTNEGMTLPTTLWTAVSVSQMSSPSICSNLSASSSVAELDTWMPSALHDRPQAMQAHQYSFQRQTSNSTSAAPCPTPTAGVGGSSTGIVSSSTLRQMASKLIRWSPSLLPPTSPRGAAFPD